MTDQPEDATLATDGAAPVDAPPPDASPPDTSPPGAPAAPTARRPVLIAIVVVVVLGVVIALGTGILGGAPTATNPISSTTDSIDRGATTYANSCARCHGVDARGGGADSATTKVPPPALSGPSSHLTAHSDGDLFTFIHDGLPGGMPQWAGTLSDNQIWDVINFLRSLKGS